MTDNIFDKFVNDKLKDHQSPVPEGLWEKIERKKDKEPRGGFWWFSGTAIWAALFFIVAGIGTGYYLMNTGEANDVQLSETASAKKNSSLATNTNGISESGDKNKNDGVPGGNASQDDGGKGHSTITSTEDELNTTTQSTEGAAKAKKEVINEGSNTSITKKLINKKDKRGNSTSSTEDVTIARNNKLNFNKKQKGNSGSTFTRKDDRTQLGISPIATADLNNTYVPFAKGKLALNSKMLSASAKDQFDLSKLKIWGIDCPTAGRPRRNDLYLEVFASPDFAMKSVSGTNSAILQKKDSTESTQLGYTAGVRFSKSIGDNLLLKAGFQFSQINERFDLKTENERRITTVITIRTVTTSSGSDTLIRDTTTLEQIGYSLRTTYNKYRSFDVPLLVSYEFGNENLKFAVNAGVILNLRSWYSGETINDSLAVVSMNSKTSPTFKQNIGLGLYAGFSVIKPLNNHLDFFLEPHFRYNLGNMTSGATYTQKFNAAGLSVGIRYKLKGQRR